MRRTCSDERVVLHVQHDMRSVQHDFSLQDSRDPAPFSLRSPVVGRELRQQDNCRVFRSFIGRGPGKPIIRYTPSDSTLKRGVEVHLRRGGGTKGKLGTFDPVVKFLLVNFV